MRHGLGFISPVYGHSVSTAELAVHNQVQSNRFAFLRQYVRNPRTVGAILPSSEELARKMVEDIDFAAASCIVEYGAGTGVFTEKLIARRRPGTVLVIIEINPHFHGLLVERFSAEKDCHIIHGSAEHIDGFLADLGIARVDYVVSGLPFASLPRRVSSTILRKTAWLLGQSGALVLFQYSTLRKTMLEAFFGELSTKAARANVPPAYVFTCRNDYRVAEPRNAST